MAEEKLINATGTEVVDNTDYDYVQKCKDFYKKIKHLPEDYVITQEDIDAERISCNYWYIRVVACYMSSTIEEIIEILLS